MTNRKTWLQKIIFTNKYKIKFKTETETDTESIIRNQALALALALDRYIARSLDH